MFGVVVHAVNTLQSLILSVGCWGKITLALDGNAIWYYFLLQIWDLHGCSLELYWMWHGTWILTIVISLLTVEHARHFVWDAPCNTHNSGLLGMKSQNTSFCIWQLSIVCQIIPPDIYWKISVLKGCLILSCTSRQKLELGRCCIMSLCDESVFCGSKGELSCLYSQDQITEAVKEFNFSIHFLKV